MVEPKAVHVDACRTLRVTAVLAHGAVLPTMFPAPLDGVLEAAARRRVLGDARWEEPVAPDRALLEGRSQAYRQGAKGAPAAVADYDRHYRRPPLPLARTAKHTGCGSRWVWAATCAAWPDGAEEDVRWFHGRSDLDTPAAAEAVGQVPANTEVGRYKPTRLPAVATVTGTLEWWCLGDQRGVAALLGDVDALGKHARMGEGRVLRWQVEDVGDPDWARIQWTATGTVARPFPARLAAWLGVDGPDTVMVEAYRPPYWRPAQESQGGFARPLKEVIAPWVKRPTG